MKFSALDTKEQITSMFLGAFIFPEPLGYIFHFMNQDEEDDIYQKNAETVNKAIKVCSKYKPKDDEEFTEEFNNIE